MFSIKNSFYCSKCCKALRTVIVAAAATAANDDSVTAADFSATATAAIASVAMFKEELVKVVMERDVGLLEELYPGFCVAEMVFELLIRISKVGCGIMISGHGVGDIH